MPRRPSLSDALSGDAPQPSAAPPAVPEPDTYKLTVVLFEEEHEALEAITAQVVARVAPRRVGKGWRTKVVRALISLAAEGETATVENIANHITAEM